MKNIKYLVGLLSATLLTGCVLPTPGPIGPTSTPTSQPTSTPTSEPTSEPSPMPEIDVDKIDVGNVRRDTLTGDIASSEDDLNNYFDFYEVSDFHGAVTYSESEKTIGLPKLGDYFRRKRAENPGGTIILSSGDMYQGSAESNLTHGYIVNYSMNVMGFEAMTLGNHEFDWGIEWLKKLSERSAEGFSIPFLGANVYDKATGQILDFLKPSTIINRGDYKIGIIGTLGDGAEVSIMKSLVNSLEFKKELPIVKEEAKRLREQEGCDIVIWSSHKDAKELAKLGISQADGINAVFGGHSHANFPAQDEPTTYIDGIPYLETKNFGRGISHACVEINKETKEIVSVTGDTVVEPYRIDLGEHEEVSRICGIYNNVIDPIKHQVIGTTDYELEVTDTFTLTDYCVDTMALEAKEWAKENGNVGIVASFHNANGGVRAKIAAGNITFGDVYKSFPFDNEICIIKASGKKIKEYFRKSSSYGVWRDVSYTALSEFDSETDYYFTTTDFMATSDSFVFKLGEEDLIRTGVIVRDAIAARIQREVNIHAEDYRRGDANPQFKPLIK